MSDVCKCGKTKYSYEEYPRPSCYKCNKLLCDKCLSYTTDGKGNFFENCTYWCKDGC